MDREFEGRKVVVISTGFGVDGIEDIGRASAIAFASRGADVAVVDNNAQRAQEIGREIEALGAKARVFGNDPRNPYRVVEIAEELAKEWPAVDVLVTHHFASTWGGLEGTSIEQFEDTVRINLTGAFAATKAFLPQLKKANRAAIVHAGSIDGTFGNTNIPAYSASKGGVHALIHCLAGEFAAYGIRVNGIARAASTSMPFTDEMRQLATQATPLGAAGTPEEYAAPVLFLASPAASYITGVILPVDGGRTAVTPVCSPGYKGYGVRKPVGA